MTNAHGESIAPAKLIEESRATCEVLELLKSQQLQIAALSGMLGEMRTGFLFEGDRKRIMEQQALPLVQHLGDYRQVMESRCKAKHKGDSYARLKVMIQLCGARLWSDLSKSKIEVARLELRKQYPKLGVATQNHYLTSLMGFCNWMVDDFRADRSPCRGLKKANWRTDVRRKRRALTNVEMLKLLAATANGKTIARIPGPERALAYLVCATTGLRAGELEKLTRASFHLSTADAYLIAEAAYAKGGRTDSIPLRGDVAVLIRAYLEQTARNDKLFRWPANGTYALQKDLKAAGIGYCVNNEYADRHSLRHTFTSDLFDQGATPKEAQTLARHQDPRLTLSRYAHVAPGALRAAVERLPALASAATNHTDVVRPAPAKIT
jgi:integrase